MDSRKKIVDKVYNNTDEDARLVKSRHGQLEYFTTMTYIDKYIKNKMKILEIGAGTGRYSITLAKKGMDVTSVEYVKHNLQVLKGNAKGLKNLIAFQGDAIKLDKLEDESFDMVLSFGPMYHLYTREDQEKAIDEAIRVTKTNGIIMFAYLPVDSFIFDCYMNGNLKAGLEENFDNNYKVKQYPEQVFTGFRIKDFENLFKNKHVKKLHSATTDSILDIMEKTKEFQMSDDEFELFKKYHLNTCENLEMQGISNHMLYICKKI